MPYSKIPGVAAGEFLRDINDPRLLGALPRDKKEADDAYVARLAAHELAVVRDDSSLHTGQAYREAMAEAKRYGIPLLVIGGPPVTEAQPSGAATLDFAEYRKQRLAAEAALPASVR